MAGGSQEHPIPKGTCWMLALVWGILSCQAPGLAGLEMLLGPASVEEGWLHGQSVVPLREALHKLSRSRRPRVVVQKQRSLQGKRLYGAQHQTHQHRMLLQPAS